MTDSRTISWILLATALASQIRGAKFNEISEIADGINHAVPTQKELQNSLSWLTAKDLISKDENKYSLTDLGKELLKQAKRKSNVLLKLWDLLEKDLEEINKNNVA